MKANETVSLRGLSRSFLAYHQELAENMAGVNIGNKYGMPNMLLVERRDCETDEQRFITGYMINGTFMQHGKDQINGALIMFWHNQKLFRISWHNKTGYIERLRIRTNAELEFDKCMKTYFDEKGERKLVYEKYIETGFYENGTKKYVADIIYEPFRRYSEATETRWRLDGSLLSKTHFRNGETRTKMAYGKNGKPRCLYHNVNGEMVRESPDQEKTRILGKAW